MKLVHLAAVIANNEQRQLAKLKRNKVFELLGAVPTNPRWSWCAMSPDHTLAVFTLWEDEIIDGQKNRLQWEHKHAPSQNGEADQMRVLDLVMANHIPAYGLVCVAQDTSAIRRSIKAVRGDYLIWLKIVKDADGVFGMHKGEISMAELVKSVMRPTPFHDDGLLDLGSPPIGSETPDRALSIGYRVIRDNDVRGYVIRRACGRCEYCGEEGFLMPNGENYLEAHHIIALSSSGRDTVDNVIALCTKHHREAHYGVGAEDLEIRFEEIVRNKQVEAGLSADGAARFSPEREPGIELSDEAT